MSRRRCVFCGSPGPLSREHVYPQWIWRRYGEDAPPGAVVQQGVSRLRENYRRAGDDTVLGRAYTAASTRPVVHATGIQVRAVCKPCNHGWMSHLENDVRPIADALLRHRRRRFTAGDVAILRRWAAKTSLRLEASDPLIRLSPASTFRAVYSDSPIPGTWYLGLARVSSLDAFDISACPVHRELVHVDDDDSESSASAHDAEPPIQLDQFNEPYMMQVLIMIERLLLVVRYSPFPIKSPARLDHDMRTHPQGCPVRVDAALTGRVIKYRDLPLMPPEAIDDFTFNWGHPVNARDAMALLGSGEQRHIGRLAMASAQDLLGIIGDVEIVGVGSTQLRSRWYGDEVPRFVASDGPD